MKIDKAIVTDATSMHRLVNYFADKGEVLPRALSEIYEDIRDYFVAKDGDGIVGCAALHVNWIDLAELRSLVVEGNSQNQGIGSLLVEACLDEANKLGIATVFCLTHSPAFFEKLGFSLIDKMELPHKVWSECYSCPKFPNCDAVALIHRLE